MNTMEVENLHKSFGNIKAVNGVSFNLQQGLISGLIGQNGAGKTTTIRMILGIYKPDSGSIKFKGVKVGQEFRNNIGYLPEERGLYKEMRILDSIIFYGQLKGMKKNDIVPKAKELLDKFDLGPREKNKVKDLSKGNQQKVQFISTIIHDPDLVILDEPFSGLDPVSVTLFKNVILDLKEKGKTVVLSSHMMDIAEKMCDRITMINKGEVVLNGSISEIKNKYSKNNVSLIYDGDISWLREIPYVTGVQDFGKYTDISLDSLNQSQDLLGRLLDRGVLVRSFKEQEASLHNIFIDTAKENTLESTLV